MRVEFAVLCEAAAYGGDGTFSCVGGGGDIVVARVLPIAWQFSMAARFVFPAVNVGQEQNPTINFVDLNGDEKLLLECSIVPTPHKLGYKNFTPYTMVTKLPEMTFVRPGSYGINIRDHKKHLLWEGRIMVHDMSAKRIEVQ
jgi:hypothetical protein